MKKLVLILVCFLIVGSSCIIFADDVETPDMKAHNARFLKKEAARPPEETSYKNTKEYKAQSPEQRRKTDQAVKKSQEGLNQLKKGGASPAR